MYSEKRGRGDRGGHRASHSKKGRRKKVIKERKIVGQSYGERELVGRKEAELILGEKREQ